MRTKITLLGATGSIGSSTLDVIAANPDKYELYAAVCGCNDEKMLDIIKRFAPKRAAIYDKDAARRLKDACALNNLSCDILEGSDGVLEIAADKEGSYVVAAIVGAMGLPTEVDPQTGVRPEQLLAAVASDKKREAAHIDYVLMEGIGRAVRRRMSLEELDGLVVDLL